MQFTTLGRTGLRVSVAGLGAGGHSRLGQRVGLGHAESVSLVRRAIELGVNFVDTAFLYGTEAIVGEGIQASGEPVIVSTKVWPYGKAGMIRGDDLLRFADGSLQRMGLEVIDIYSLHGVLLEDYPYCRDELVPVLLRLKEQGKIRYPGLTERFNSDPAHRMLDEALKDDFFDVIMVGLSLLNPSALASILPRARASGVGTQIMFAVRRALSQPEVLMETVAALIERGEVSGAAIDRDRPLDFLLEDAESLVEAAYRFCRHAPGTDIILTGTGNVAHLEENLRFIQGGSLSPAALERLHSLFGAVDSVTGE